MTEGFVIHWVWTGDAYVDIYDGSRCILRVVFDDPNEWEGVREQLMAGGMEFIKSA